ncbi:MAG TPA: DUF1549 domain-containing protein, partial [Pirellulaceae bacterium]|nr:DUF1549 domain-containing protein [Pirellulaceae bacterium]
MLKTWVEQGAQYQNHWSFVAPVKPTPPAVKRADWSRNPIDQFIFARLEQAGLAPSREADKPTLLRRLTLDLTGLPPTPAEVDSFLADDSSQAYERVVDRLLSSPNFGERMAVDWLDASRFADTNGYHIDNGRDMTRWRDWVIRSFNKNLGFDQFTIEQLAGDLLPNATLEQKIASGFHRNHMINFEGGAIPDEYHNAYIVDRVNTTGTVWLGLSIACAQCHEHKYDPVSQKEYYQLYAFFYNVPERGLDGNKGNSAPLVRAPSPDQEEQLKALDAAIAKLQEQLAAPSPAADAGQVAWEREVTANRPAAWRELVAARLSSPQGSQLKQRAEDRVIEVSGANPDHDSYVVEFEAAAGEITALRLETLPHASLGGQGPGRSDNGNFVLTDVRLSVGGGNGRKLAWGRASAGFNQKDFGVELAIDAERSTGWAIYPQVGQAHTAVFSLAEPLKLE